MAEAYVVRRARREELEEVVDLCMVVEEAHERYWPLRWVRRQGQREGWLRWLGGHMDDERMLILVAVAGGGVVGGEVAGTLLAVIEEEMPIYT